MYAKGLSKVAVRGETTEVMRSGRTCNPQVISLSGADVSAVFGDLFFILLYTLTFPTKYRRSNQLLVTSKNHEHSKFRNHRGMYSIGANRGDSG